MLHCFYHSADLDGHCSGAIVKYRFPDAVMHPINYGDPFPWDEIKEDDEVYMVDFALQPVENMHRLCLHETNVIWIDHHSSAIKAVEEIGLYPAGLRDTTKAACELTWEYLFPDRPVPLAVKLLSLYDSWTYQGHELEDMVLPFQMRMKMEELDPKNFTSIRNSPWIKYLGPLEKSARRYIDEDIYEGHLLLRYDEANKAKYARTYAFETILSVPFGWEAQPYLGKGRTFAYFDAIAVNLGHTNSKVFDSVWGKKCPECDGAKVVWIPETNDPTTKQTCYVCNGTGYIEPFDLMITFVRRPDKLWNVSLYSTKDHVDCSIIAKNFGGGGHKGAAGFQCKDLPFKI